MLRFTYVNGPTALIELEGLRLLTDPTFDEAGRDYRTPAYVLHKLTSPALRPETLGAIDAVLLSHDHHFDNLDVSGRAVAAAAQQVITTQAGASRLGGNAVGLAPWESLDLPSTAEAKIQVIATPARHGPVDGDRGPVIGFILRRAVHPEKVIYLSGDTVWYEGVAEVGRRFKVEIAILFMGAARVREVGPAHLTFTAAEAVEAARAFDGARIIPLHCEGWAHFSESRADIEKEFAKAGLQHRLCWPPPGRGLELAL
ncbi:MAG TPA: MBL fold metallo-hydrolase [Opitutaceae bacterium]|nr:MBL fold metallo-hydrolase [Opitutaceae bacterium]